MIVKKLVSCEIFNSFALTIKQLYLNSLINIYMAKTHSFHIPVLGIGYSLDSPLKVSHLGIDSVISLVDDVLMEKMRKMYCDKLELPYKEITSKIDDFRAKRITTYLNMIQEQAEKKLDDIKQITDDKMTELKDYFNLLPNNSTLKNDWKNFTSKLVSLDEIKTWLDTNLSIGNIDVNIMTKVDKDNFKNGEKLPIEFNDAHAALRGFAESDLSSSIVLSAGMNPRLFSYFENFKDFYPNKDGYVKKKIILKVSDFRSALLQGTYLAKKGLWVSEYRIESGLNCGGHAFATEGHLMGPILAQFRDQKRDLIEPIFNILKGALEAKGLDIPEKEMALKITAQGGVGTAEEQEFLENHYKVDSVGWGTAMLLVPEATSVDDETIDKLINAKEEHLYLSNISPLGVPFNSLKGNTKDIEKQELIDAGKPGSHCPRQYVKLNYEYTEKGLCTASSRFQKIKIKELDEQNLSELEHKVEYDKIVDKSCICLGLGISSMKAHGIEVTKAEGHGISVCPGPNMAYFSKRVSLKDMIDHIYGRANVISRNDRPNMFIKEIGLYIDYLKKELENTSPILNRKQKKYFDNFVKNMKSGVEYYQGLFSEVRSSFDNKKSEIMSDLEMSLQAIESLTLKVENLKKAVVTNN